MSEYKAHFNDLQRKKLVEARAVLSEMTGDMTSPARLTPSNEEWYMVEKLIGDIEALLGY